MCMCIYVCVHPLQLEVSGINFGSGGNVTLYFDSDVVPVATFVPFGNVVTVVSDRCFAVITLVSG